MAYTQAQLEQGIKNAIAAGDNQSANEIANLLDTQFPDRQPLAPVTDITPQPESTLLERAGEVIQRRGAGIGETLSRPLDLGLPQEGALGAGEKLVRTLGDVAGGVGEIAGDAIMTGIFYLTPDLAKEAVDDAFNYVSQTEAGKEGLRLATLSADKYKGWADANPDDAKLLESYFNIGAFLTPATKIKAPILDVAETLEDTGGNLIKNGRSKIRGEERELITAMLEPDAKHLTGEDFDVSEITQKITYNPKSPYTQETLDIVADSGVVKPKKTYTYNSKKLGEAAKKERRILEARLGKEDVVLNKANTIGEIQTKAQEFLDEAQRTIGDETKLKQVNSIFGEAVRQIQNSDGSLLGLLEARRGVDKFTRSFDGKVDYTTQNSLSTASRAVRNAMNEIIEREAKNTEVSRSLRKQAAFLDSAKIVNKKISKDGRHVLTRVGKVVGNYLPRTPIAIAATASTGAGFVATGWPLLAAGVGAALVYGGGKAALSGQSRELLGKIIADTGTAIKKAEKMGHLDAVEQMKADRLVLVSLLNESPTEEPED
tara:strand:+ start:1245 stop:2876 length:1632 start_codon:yes stop_codon:yes gene_type:complete